MLPLTLVLVVSLCLLLCLHCFHTLLDLILVLLLCSGVTFTPDQLFAMTVTTITEALEHGRIAAKRSAVGM